MMLRIVFAMTIAWFGVFGAGSAAAAEQESRGIIGDAIEGAVTGAVAALNAAQDAAEDTAEVASVAAGPLVEAAARIEDEDDDAGITEEVVADQAVWVDPGALAKTPQGWSQGKKTGWAGDNLPPALTDGQRVQSEAESNVTPKKRMKEKAKNKAREMKVKSECPSCQERARRNRR